VAKRSALPGTQFALRRNEPAVRVVKPPTSSFWVDVVGANAWRESLRPPTTPNAPMLYLFDLNDVTPTPPVLDAALRTLARDIQLGRYGESAIVVSSQDPSVRRHIELLASAENLPIYLSNSTTNFGLVQAEPAMHLSATDRQTLRAVLNQGGSATAPQIAKALSLAPTAAINRLSSLERRGLLFKREQPGRQPDLYIDVRAASLQYGEATLNAALEDVDEHTNGKATHKS
jgi:predicted transcriptional regulator